MLRSGNKTQASHANHVAFLATKFVSLLTHLTRHISDLGDKDTEGEHGRIWREWYAVAARFPLSQNDEFIIFERFIQRKLEILIVYVYVFQLSLRKTNHL